MEPSRPVWRWASGILAVVCLALIALNFLLPREDEPAAPPHNSTDGFFAASAPDPVGPAANTAGVAARHDESSGAAEAKAPASSTRSAARATSNLRAERTPPREPGRADVPAERKTVVGRGEDTPSGIVPKSHTDFVPEIASPLGYVETADGQKKAIIGEGEWIQLVAEGQTLPDNSRVVRVTSTSVEISRGNETKVALLQTVPRLPEAAQAVAASAAPEQPDSELVAEDHPDAAEGSSLAEVADSPKGPASVQLASAPTQERLPHEVEAEASLAPSWRVPPVGPEPRLAEPRMLASAGPPRESALPPSTPRQVAGPLTPLGFVQKADGTMWTVMSDGDSVRLEEQPLFASVTPPSLPADLPGWINREGARGTPSRLISVSASPGGPNAGIGRSVTLKALGYIERANGRVQAILDAGDSVQLVEEGELLADGSRVVGITPTSVEVAFGPSESPGGPSAREQDLLVAATAGSGISSRLRSPPTEGRLAALEPVPKARGMPAMGGRAAYSRPPPEHNARDWIEARSRAQPTEETEQASTTCRSLPASTQREACRASSARGEVCARNGGSGDVDGPSEPPGHYSIHPLGFVEWPGGRIQAIVSRGDGVELLEEGQVLTDGSRVLAVSHGAVELSRSLVALSGGHGTSPERVELPEGFLTAGRGADGGVSAERVVFSPAPSGVGVPAVSGFLGSGSVSSLERLGGNELQMKWPLRDNRNEPRK